MTMFAQLTTMHCLPDMLDELAALYEERVVPITQAQMGYRGMYLLLDRGAGKILAVSLWDSEEDAVSYEGSAEHQDHLTRLAGYLAATPAYEGYEVSVDA
jgi:heme-degrading monooxygenase HmoA